MIFSSELLIKFCLISSLFGTMYNVDVISKVLFIKCGFIGLSIKSSLVKIIISLSLVIKSIIFAYSDIYALQLSDNKKLNNFIVGFFIIKALEKIIPSIFLVSLS